MGITAMLAILGISAWISLRNSSALDNAAEVILSAVQNAQTRSIAISSDGTSNAPKIWAININSQNDTLYLDSYYDKNTSGNDVLTLATINSVASPSVLTSVQSIALGTSSDGLNCNTTAQTYNNYFIDFSTPFGFATALSDSCNLATSGTCSNGATYWGGTSSTVGFWALNSSYASQSLFSNNSYVCVQLAGKGSNSKETVFISKDGDSYVER